MNQSRATTWGRIWVELLFFVLVPFYAIFQATTHHGVVGGGLLYPVIVVASLALCSRWATVRIAIWASAWLIFKTIAYWDRWDDVAFALRIYTLIAIIVIAILSFQIRLQWARVSIGRKHSQHLIENSPDAVVSMDVAGRVTEWNSQAEQMFGFSRAEVLGRALADLIVPQNFRSAFVSSLERFLHTGETGILNRRVEVMALRRDRTEFPVELIVVAIGDEQEMFFTAIVRDMSQQRAMLAELVEANDKLESVLNSTAEAIFGIDRDGRCTFCNPSCVEMLGYRSDDELLGQLMHTMIHPPQIDGSPSPWEGSRIIQAMRHQHRIHVDDEVFWRQDGSHFAVEYWCYPLVRNDEHVGAVVTFLDVTEQRRAAEYRRQTAAIVDSTSDAIIGKDLHGRVTSWNRGAELIYGYTADEMIGQKIFRTLPDGLENEEPEILASVATGIQIQQFETTRQTKDGRRIDVSMTISPIYDDQGNLTGTSTIERDVTRDKADQNALRQAKEMAERANQARGEFLANVSHELRTPMNAILGMTDLALEEDLPDEVRHYIQIANDSGKSLLTLLNDILDFSKLESGKFTLEPESVSVGDLIDEVAQPLAEQAFEKGLELIVDANPFQLGKLDCDPLRLRQIIMNLVSNAIKFTDQGEVTIRAHIRERHNDQALLRIEVSDTGIGIAPEDQRRILDPFTQVDASSTRRFGGTGLGLAICQELLNLMGSHLQISSNVGEGSRFWFELTLPIVQHGTTAIAPRDYLSGVSVLVVDDNETNRTMICSRLAEWGMFPEAASDYSDAVRQIERKSSDRQAYQLGVIKGALANQEGFRLAGYFQQATEPSPPIIMTIAQSERQQFRELAQSADSLFRLNKPILTRELFLYVSRLFDPEYRDAVPVDSTSPAPIVSPASRILDVLVAEDTQANQVLITRFLRKRGHRVTLAINGRDAVEKIHSSNHDLVLMDVQMPVMDGFQATASIREWGSAVGCYIPIVAMTAYAMRGDRERCLSAGMDAHLAKPISFSRLIETVEEVAKLAKYERKNEASSFSPEFSGSSETPQCAANLKEFDDVTITSLSNSAHQPLQELTLATNATVAIDAILNRLGGDRSLFRDLIKIFVEDSSILLDQIRLASANQEVGSLERAAHALKGLASNFSPNDVESLAQQLEALARHKSLIGVDDRISELSTAIDSLSLRLSEVEMV